MKSGELAMFSKVCFVTAALMLCVSAAGAQPVTPDEAEPKWHKEMWDEQAAFRVLFKKDAVGSAEPELSQWQNGTIRGKEARIARLESALMRHPRSPFAGNIALLLARSRYFFNHDAEKAITDLYEVAKKYPNEKFVADDPVMREYVAEDVFKHTRQEVLEFHREN